MLNRLKEEKLIAIFRGLTYESLIWRIELLLEHHFSIIEITLDSPNALQSIEQLKRKFGNELEIGAGAVTNSLEVKDVQQAGGTFIISPHLDERIVKETKERNLISIPGVMTATEVWQAKKFGADVCKIFLASSLGASYAKQLKGPFPHISLLATGDINEKNAFPFIESGYDVVGVGSSLTACDDRERLKNNCSFISN